MGEGVWSHEVAYVATGSFQRFVENPAEIEARGVTVDACAYGWSGLCIMTSRLDV